MSGARPFRPAVAVLALNAVARAHEAPSQPQAVFAAVDHALAGEIGHRLFTILSYDPDSGVATRLYSNLPDAYPAGGSKTVMPGPWTDTVLARGECYIGYTPDDLRSVFADHELIASLDCQSVLNVPIAGAAAPGDRSTCCTPSAGTVRTTPSPAGPMRSWCCRRCAAPERGAFICP